MLAPGHRTLSILAALFWFFRLRPVLLRHALQLLLDGLSSQDAALPPMDSGPRAFGGLHHLAGFLPPPSEGYNISTARTSSMADLALLRKFPLCIRVFFMLDALAHILIFGSVQHLYASYIYVLCLPAPTPFFLLHFLLSYFSFLFSRAPLCAIYLEGYISYEGS